MKVTINISHRRIEDLLCAAFEGGSNYWARAEGGKKPIIKANYLFEWPTKGGSFVITDLMDNNKKYEVDLESLKRGMEVFSGLEVGHGGHHFPDFIAENDDSGTGDVFLQCCVFGKIIYS